MMNDNQYDEIKNLLKRSRLLTEQPIGAPNIGADIEEIENDFLKHLKGVNNDDVCLMPEGVTADDLMTRSY